MRILVQTVISIMGLLSAVPQDSAETLIRNARARFNTAIAAHDTTTLDRDWSDDITVIASRGSVSVGRAAYRAALLGDFKNRPGVVYRRTPASVTIHAALNLATEEGEWVGSWTDADGNVEAGGRYIAQWRLAAGRWLLHAEAFGLIRATR